MESPRVGILMGSKSDAAVMRQAAEILAEFGISWELRVLSAHRTPEETRIYAETAEERGIDILIAGAGFAAHLAGVLAAHTTLPILGVPLDPSALKGLDERERRIIEERHLSERPTELKDIGKEMGISKQRVYQLERRAISKLKNHLQDLNAP